MFAVLSINQLERMSAEGVNLVFIDLRLPEAFASGHLPGSVNIPFHLLSRDRLEPYRGRLLVFGCEHGGKSMLAARDFGRIGFRTASLGCGIPVGKAD